MSALRMIDLVMLLAIVIILIIINIRIWYKTKRENRKYKDNRKSFTESIWRIHEVERGRGEKEGRREEKREKERENE